MQFQVSMGSIPALSQGESTVPEGRTGRIFAAMQASRRSAADSKAVPIAERCQDVFMFPSFRVPSHVKQW